MELSTEDLPLMLDSDDAFANRITYLLGRIINRCLRQDGVALDRSEWEYMVHALESWKSGLPPSFNPIATAEPQRENEFPLLWTISTWHSMQTPSGQGYYLLTWMTAAGLQYYHTAKIILQLAEPAPPLNTLERMDRISAFEDSVNHHATFVCALAISSDSAAIWVNSFGPISFCKTLIHTPRSSNPNRWEMDQGPRKEKGGN